MDFSYKKIWAITLPVLIGMVMEHLLGMTDAIFMGRVGEVEFGASGLGSTYFLAMFVVGMGFATGAQILMARRNGQGQFRAIGHIFSQGTAIMLGIAVVLWALSNLLAPVILSTADSDAVYNAALTYVRWRSFGLVFAFTAAMFRAYYVAITKTRILTVASILMVACNVLFNWVLIFGKFGFPAMGIKGAAVGSVLAEAVMCAFIFVYTRYGTDYRNYGLFRFTRMSWDIVRQIFSVSGWTMLQHFLSCGTWFFFFMAAEQLGESTLASSNLIRLVSSMLYLFVAAFAITGSSMVSNLMGAGDSGKVLMLCGRIVKICALSTFPLVLFSALFPSLVMSIYTTDSALIANAVPAFMVMLCSYVFATPGYVYFLAISGTGNTRHAMMIELVAIVSYAIYTYVVAFYLHAGLPAIWGVEIMYGVLLLTICYVYLRKSRWREKII
jgi:putative MATE family efflux protein